jgi:putative PIN family toxin of toxin-antitoxin system
VRFAGERKFKLFVSEYVLAEIRDLPNDEKVEAKFGLTVETAERFVAELLTYAEYCEVVPKVYQHPHDPDDSHYIDLAVATKSNLVVSRDRHLLALNVVNLRREWVQEFRKRFPDLRILDPVDFLRWFEAQTSTDSKEKPPA